jgi:uracil-DNA glycosylase
MRAGKLSAGHYSKQLRDERPRGLSHANALKGRVIACRLCPRLVKFRENVKPRTSFAGEDYWRRPVPGFGDINGRLLVVGLSPAAHGANRTGRVFTGDSSGRFLVRALHSAGFANQPLSEARGDGLVYTDCYVTAAVKCAPPGDKPSRAEFRNCSTYLDEEISMMTNLRSVLTLGALAFRAYLDHLSRTGEDIRGLKFSHGNIYRFEGRPTVYASYHPSPRNTNTGVLTQDMLAKVLGGICSDFLKA